MGAFCVGTAFAGLIVCTIAQGSGQPMFCSDVRIGYGGYVTPASIPTCAEWYADAKARVREYEKTYELVHREDK